jgi:hypothetical protein
LLMELWTLSSEEEARPVQERHKECAGKDETIEQHLVRPLAALGVFFGVAPDSIQARAPEDAVTANSDMPVIQDSHVPMLWVNAYTAIITTQIAAATQNTTVNTESAVRMN